jgi:5-methyltetrahydropteroyltriglutamate--homocysteine methyltransferase
VLIPGVIDNTTAVIEHPETVADRLLRFGRLVGKERLIGGVNCGFGNALPEVLRDERVVWAKLSALSEGAAIASRRL